MLTMCREEEEDEDAIRSGGNNSSGSNSSGGAEVISGHHRRRRRSHRRGRSNSDQLQQRQLLRRRGSNHNQDGVFGEYDEDEAQGLQPLLVASTAATATATTMYSSDDSRSGSSKPESPPPSPSSSWSSLRRCFLLSSWGMLPVVGGTRISAPPCPRIIGDSCGNSSVLAGSSRSKGSGSGTATTADDLRKTRRRKRRRRIFYCCWFVILFYVGLTLVNTLYTPHLKGPIDDLLTLPVTFSYIRRQQQHRDDAAWAATNAAVRDLVPPTKTNIAALNLNTHAALREWLVRQEQRKHVLHSLLERQADTAAAAAVVSTTTATSPKAARKKKKDRFTNSGNSDYNNHHQQQQQQRKIPPVLFVPSWVPPPRPGLLAKYEFTMGSISYDETDMRQLVERTLQEFFASSSSPSRPEFAAASSKSSWTTTTTPALRLPSDDLLHLLWSLCVAYVYGGVVALADAAATTTDDADDVDHDAITRTLLDDLLDRGVLSTMTAKEEHHDAQVLAAVAVAENTTTTTNEEDDPESNKKKKKKKDGIPAPHGPLYLLAASPRNDLVACVLQEILGRMRNQQQQAPQLVGSLLPQIFQVMAAEDIKDDSTTTTDHVFSSWTWQRFMVQNGKDDGSCSLASDDSTESSSTGSLLYTKVLPKQPQQPQHTDLMITEPLVHVEVKESIDDRQQQENISNSRRPKVPLQSLMRNHYPGWLCNRCMNWALYGNYRRCRSVCPREYERIMCDSSHPLFRERKQKKTREIQVNVTKRHKRKTLALSYKEKAIPRIIHQTWFEDITYDRYPQLARIQASWRIKGWDFRFYTDDAARGYIGENYPPRFLEAFDALIHGAFKADYFRYLVLLKEGGVYADVDVKLETSLDDFITPSLSFFAARDMPCDYAGEAYCLWNGFMASAPGHPIMVRMVERLVNFIHDRADLYDMEQDTCHRSAGGDDGSLEVWKIRAEQALFLSGPCGLGVAMNEALSRPLLQTLSFGWIGMENLEFEGSEQDHGDALILVADKHDHGQFRFSDPDRNIVVASTDIPGVDKKPRGARQQQQQLRSGTTGVSTSDQPRIEMKQTPHYSTSVKGVAVWGSSNVYTDNLVATERVSLKVAYYTT